MRTTIALATFLVVGAGAVSVNAISLKGSDTLEGITTALLTDPALDCGGTLNTPNGSLIYAGTGSSNGESAIIGNTQAVAPMSRFLNPSAPASGQVCSLPNTPFGSPPAAGDAGQSESTSEGIAFARDGLSIVVSEVTGGNDTCNGTEGAPCVPALAKGLAYDPTPTTLDGTDNILAVPGYVCPAAGDVAPYAPADPNCVAGQYKILDSRDVLRLVYFGLDHDFINANQRNCGNPNASTALLSNPGRVRAVLLETWGNLFRDPVNCPSCTRLWRAFRRNDESGTTDAFTSLTGRRATCAAVASPCTSVGEIRDIGVPSIDQATRRSLFCNVRQAAGVQCGPGASGGFDNATPATANDFPHKIAGSGLSNTPACSPSCSRAPAYADPPPPPTAPGGPLTTSTAADTWDWPDSAFGTIGFDPYFTDLQDNDCIRRQCSGPFGAPREQVCGARGDLGVVLPIWDPPTGDANSDPFANTACTGGRFQGVTAPPCGPSGPSTCPNGQTPVGAACPINPGTCLQPYLGSPGSYDFRCLNDALNRPGSGRLVDGRVYNLHLHSNITTTNPDYPYLTAPRQNPSSPGSLLQAKMVASYFRIHQSQWIELARANHLVTRARGDVSATQSTPAGATGPGCNPAALAPEVTSATNLIGCFVGRGNRCAIGFAGASAAEIVSLQAEALRLNGVSPEPTCVRDDSYVLSRKLYLNTVKGFEVVQSVAPDEFKLAKCFADRNIVDTKVTNAGFITLTANPADGTECRDFDELAMCGASSNVDACQGNPAGIPSHP